MSLPPAQTTDQNIWADLLKNQRDARCPIPGADQKEIAKWLSESASAFFLAETSVVPPLKCVVILLHTGLTGHETFDLCIQPVVTIADPQSPDGVDWVDDGALLQISCQRPEAYDVAYWLLPRIGRRDMYGPATLMDGSTLETLPASDGFVKLATRGARFLQQAREQAAVRAAAVGGAGR